MDRTEEFILSGCRTRSLITHGSVSPYGYLDVHLPDNAEALEVPDFVTYNLAHWLTRGYSLISYYLSSMSVPTSRRLVRGALSDFMQSAFRRHFASVLMTNGRKYHGAPGAIFDADFNLLFLMTTTVSTQYIEDRGRRVSFLRHNCRVAPEVFAHQDSIIEKTIIKKMIPYCATHITEPRDYPSLFSGEGSEHRIFGTPIRIIVEDINPLFIRRIVAPTISSFTPEAVHSILSKNIEYLISDVS